MLMLRLIAYVIVAVFVAEAALAQQTTGLFQNDVEAYPGYTLFNKNGTSYLIDNAGLVVHTWAGGNRFHPGYLLDNGNLLAVNAANGGFKEITWDSTEIWSYIHPGSHHDIAPLPNGNILAIARETFTNAEAIAAGRDPALLDDELSPLIIVEIAYPGTVVWEWHLWDHMVQDFDASKANHGVVADSPELADLNYVHKTNFDWIHANGIDYNPILDQIVITARHFNEIWVIDHSTTTAQAATGAGGNSGVGGEILYRWGNPMAYGAGTIGDRQLFGLHDAHWIDPGLSGAGHIMIFNNGTTLFGGPGYSTVDEIITPTDGYAYSLTSGSAFLPAAPTWSYQSTPTSDFYSINISGAQRLPNGNTLIDQGDRGILFEVTSAGEVVWRYVNPTDGVPLAWNAITENSNSLFRAYRYPTDHPAFAGKDLTPTDAIEIWDSYLDLTLQSSPGGQQISRPEGTHPYGEGQLVTLTAEADFGYAFTGWTVEAGSATIDDPMALHTTFNMGSLDTTVQANFIETLAEVPSMSFWGAPLVFFLSAAAIAIMRRRGDRVA
jgi:hypothetical protein